MSKLLFLGYDRRATRLVEAIEAKGWKIEEFDEPVSDLSGYDLVISYGYRHIIRQPVLDTLKRPALNLHIACLPWNRGAHPLFWAAFDGTPAGVTIHEIDAGIDTGPICFQQTVDMNFSAETFASGYKLLIAAMEELFIANIDTLLNGKYTSRSQLGRGSMKRVKDLPSGFSWSDGIEETIQRLRDPASPTAERTVARAS